MPLKSTDERAIHIKKILHKKVGETFSAGIIDGNAGNALITKIGEAGAKDQGDIYFTFTPTSNGKKLFPLKMIIGFPRPIQLKRLLRDVATLGVEEVHLTGTELGEKSYMKSSLAQKEDAYKMLIDGSVQAASTHVPKLFIHKTLSECIKKINCNTSADSYSMLKMALDNVNPSCALTTFLQKQSSIQTAIAAIGSERGWTQKERNLLEANGFIRLGMGNRVMRTETASTVSAAIILSNMGALNE